MKKTEDNRSAEKEMSMNHKMKLGYMALGAGILAIGIIIGQIITPDIKAQNIKTQNIDWFEKIRCREIQVMDKRW